MNTPISPRRRAAFLKSSSLTGEPICSPLAVAIQASGYRLLPFTLMAINCRAEAGICASGCCVVCGITGTGTQERQ